MQTEEASVPEIKSSNAPPYVAFTTLRGFIRKLGEKTVPSRIDRTVMASVSGGVQSQLTSALKYLKLIDSLSVPTETFHKLAGLAEPDEKQVWKALIEASYPFLFEDLNLKNATTGQVIAAFAKLGVSGDTTSKCISFFLAACGFAGIAVSAHVRPARPRTSGTRKKQAKPASSDTGPTDKDQKIVQPVVPIAGNDVTRLLLDKFPSFDPGWPDELKKSWFVAYQDLMKRNK